REVEWAKTSEEAWWHLLTYLVKTKNLTFSSIWSPTYWLEVAKSIESHWSELKSLRKDVFDGPEAGPLFFQKLWPQLQVISCWDSGPSARFVGELQSLFPNVKIHSKGVWSTEAAVTLPIRDKKVLAFTSHYFEFLCLENQKIVKGWDLQPGQRVAPLLWTASGLRNYLLGDQLRVTEIWNGLPCFEFEGRLATADLVGEKIDESIAASLIQEIEVLFQELEIKAVPASLVANAHLRRYELAIVGSSVFKVKDQLDRLLERRLCESHHYQLARDLSQLKPATVCFFNEHKDIAATYLPDAVKGQVKVQQLITYQ
ncbi:MAG: GH3 auxin-responsive promoter family protein, partial [Bdellovibrionales bacterium]|nr:GH3 auxin-responsive promoter family protein [Bdellovibrionales bacterium]